MSQPLQALEVANARRLRRSAIKNQVKEAAYSGPRRELAKLLRSDDVDPAVASTRLWDMLGWAFRMTDQEREGVLRYAGIGDAGKDVGRLTLRQRRAVAVALEDPDVWKSWGDAA